jgi:hypothetical protein
MEPNDVRSMCCVCASTCASCARSPGLFGFGRVHWSVGVVTNNLAAHRLQAADDADFYARSTS